MAILFNFTYLELIMSFIKDDGSAQYRSNLSTPMGDFFVLCSEHSLQRAEFFDSKPALEQATCLWPENPLSLHAKQQLLEYFGQKRQRFDLPLNPKGTDFRLQSWQALLNIPFGQTASYSEQAQVMNKPKAVRAVGGANGANPISIIIPCHRVIGKNGSLTGYAGGLSKKQWLLHFEQSLALNKQDFELN